MDDKASGKLPTLFCFPFPQKPGDAVMPDAELAAPMLALSPRTRVFSQQPWTGSWRSGKLGAGREGSGRGRARLHHHSTPFASDHSYDFSPPWTDTVQRQHSPDLHTQSGESLKAFLS